LRRVKKKISGSAGFAGLREFEIRRNGIQKGGQKGKGSGKETQKTGKVGKESVERRGESAFPRPCQCATEARTLVKKSKKTERGTKESGKYRSGVEAYFQDTPFRIGKRGTNKRKGDWEKEIRKKSRTNLPNVTWC